MTAVVEETVARQNTTTAASTSLALETAARFAADNAVGDRLTTEVARLDAADAYLLMRSDSTNAAVSNNNQEIRDRVLNLENSTNQRFEIVNMDITNISTQQISNLGSTIANETARAQQIENDLQQ